MNRQPIFLLFSLLVLIFTNTTIAQTTSPYSKLGMGETNTQVFSVNKGMAEMSAAYTSAIAINKMNPASYADISYTTFELGAGIDARNFRVKDTSYSSFNGNFSHIAAAFPLWRGKIGMSFGVLPHSALKYNFSQTIVDTAKIYSGKGGLYEVYGGFGGKYNGFSIGINLGYVFGSNNYYRGLIFNDTLGSVNIQNNNSIKVKGFRYNFGLQYKKILIKKNEQNKNKADIGLIVGLYGNPVTKYNATNDNQWERYFYYNSSAGTQVYLIDTPLIYNSKKMKITMPYQIAAGIAIGNDAWWLVGAEFKYDGWSKYSNPAQPTTLKDSWRMSAGFSILPNGEKKAYLSRMTYRAGVYGGKTPYTIGTVNIAEVGGTVGLTFPFPFKKPTRIFPEQGFARLVLNADFGKRFGATNGITENYYRLQAGIAFNSQWFIKRKFD